MNKISIIIPIYNSEKYLHRCLNSILKQSYKDYEVIMVDDGSTDESGKICDDYSKKYNNFIAFHKSNSGQSDSRNYGTKHSSGNLIMYLDSDDELIEGCLEELVKVYENNGSDLIFFRNNVILNGQNIKCSNCTNEIITFANSKEAYEYSLDSGKLSCCLWSRMYSRELALRVNTIPGILCEDIESTHRYIYSAKKISLIDKPFYNYYVRNDSTMGKKKQSHMFDIYVVANIVYSFEKQEFSNTKYMKIINTKYVNNCLKAYSFLYESDDNNFRKEKMSEIEKTLNNISLFINVKFKTKIIFGLYKINKKLACNIINKIIFR